MLSLIRKTTRKVSSGAVLKSCYLNCLSSRSIHAAASAPHEGAATGLYGFEQLKSPKGFRRFVDEAIERSGELVTFISSMPSSAEVIRAMDEISNRVCSVFDSAELCRQTHPDREFVEEANKAAMRMSEYFHFLNTNHTLYNAVKKAEREAHLLTREAHMAAHFLRVDFERAGIHLSAERLDRVNQLSIEISQLCQEYKENIVIDPGSVDIFPPMRVPNNLHHLVKPIYRSSKSFGSISSMKEKGFRLMTDADSLSSILQYTSDDEVRKMAYVKGNSSPCANLDVLDKIIATRHELAQILGYRSYAEFAVTPNMASSPAVVVSFLQELSNLVRPSADEEFNQIKEFKLKKRFNKFEDLEPWDEAYYTSMMKSTAYNLNSSVISSYFPLSQCIEGLKTLVNSLFGASFNSIPLAPGESWHPDVLKLSLHHPEEGDLGYLYLDLYSRKGKYPGCAHFAIQGGCKVSEMEYQLPVVALVCNFSGSRERSNVRLNHSEVETLFHEFGHALHSLLSRTEYQHFSGTRVVLDLAETPSNLFEYYASDYRVLRTFAKHYSTGEVIPEKLVKSMQGAKKMFAATELQRQILYALIDQTLFGERLTSERDTSSVVAELKRQCTSWKHVDGTHWQTRFFHLLTYGAGYYSYLYAKCFAATIWEKLCQEDPLSRSTGTALRTKFLQHGGSKEPVDLLKDLVGDGIIRYCDGGVIPDITSLCKEMDISGKLVV
ncbi:mitochondrial intermediate peptidase, mitochondrial isoform X1 [Cucurbita moschata]|uniref:Mitochondrial intermediate peptidase, mitochondrial isoform X1 n=2 Tax=Cucurbita moschata TaxID=3662 RepID=A0A6J1FLV9_CUCMO|nr:mitochondrial intermediate peptidase, mitochondrial isoform X1 [Cucurbita moschata]